MTELYFCVDYFFESFVFIADYKPVRNLLGSVEVLFTHFFHYFLSSYLTIGGPFTARVNYFSYSILYIWKH